MPFRSIAQRKFMWARKPRLAKEWTEKYGSRIRPKKKRKGLYNSVKRKLNA